VPWKAGGAAHIIFCADLSKIDDIPPLEGLLNSRGQVISS